jgi:hypothetical protein
MRVYVLTVLVAGLLFASDDQKQRSPGELSQLTTLEKQVLDAWKNQNGGTLQRLLRDDYIQLSGSGPERMTKTDVLKALPRARIADYTLEDVRLLPLSRDAALLTYKLQLKGLPEEQGLFANQAYVASVWVREDAAWLSVFRQWTPLHQEGSGLSNVTSFETSLTPDGVRYLYKGTTKLEDVHATLDIHLHDGKVSTHTYWATWQPGELKELGLGFLAFGVGSVQRIDFSGRATRDGRRVLLSNVARRDARIPADLKSVPPSLKLP